MGSHPERHVLALDTSADPCSVAVRLGAGVVHERVARDGDRAGAVLHALIAEALAEARLELADIGLLAVVSGPGSFTGLRVGLAAVQGLAMATGIPVVTVEATLVVARASGADGPLLVVVDGGQGRFVARAHEASAGHVAPAGPLEDLAPSDLASRLGQRRLVVRGGLAVPTERGPALRVQGGLAGVVAGLAATLAPVDGSTIEPLYVRPPAIRPATGARPGRGSA